MLSTIKDQISVLYKQHKYILDSKQIIDYDKKDFKKIMKGTEKRSLLIDSLTNLACHLKTYFHVKSIILIDEYDWLMEHAGDSYDDANSFFRTMYSNVAKVSYPSLLASTYVLEWLN